MISASNSQIRSVEIRATDAAGISQPIAHLTGAVRPGQSVSFTLDIFNAQLVAENMADVTTQVTDFLKTLREYAVVHGLPMG